jgi:hypothetical protein
MIAECPVKSRGCEGRRAGLGRRATHKRPRRLIPVSAR